MPESIRVAVSGQPNCGKSTMFNAITGGSARVGNYPGITVDRLEGTYRQNGTISHLVDLPGTYSLTSYSMEELVARNVIVDEHPDVVINMVDATALERSLYLALQLLEIGAPLVLGLNMMDEVKRSGVTINVDRLSKLLGVPVVPCVARVGQGREELMQAVAAVAKKTGGVWKPLRLSYGPDLDPILDGMTQLIENAGFLTGRYDPRWVAVKYLESDEQVMVEGKKAGPAHDELVALTAEAEAVTLKNSATTPDAIIADWRYGFINGLLKQGVVAGGDELRRNHSDAIDRVVTHRLLGPCIMLAVLYLMFQVTFTIGEYPKGWLEAGFEWLSGLGTAYIPEGHLQSLIVSGIIGGVGSVMSFTPLICIMFLMLVFLEDLGYMARVAYMMDRVLRIFGLHGMSVMPLIISGGIPGGCAVPGVMSARTLRSPRERLATILTAPFMVCGAKTTAYLMLVAAFFPDNPTRAMFLVVLCAWGFVLLVSKLLRSTVIRGESTPFVMEIPPYRLPTLRGVILHTWERVWQYIKKAGTVILAVSILMWAVMTFPELPEDTVARYEAQRQAVVEKVKAANPEADEEAVAQLAEEDRKAVSDEQNEAALKYSVAGRVGEALTPVTNLAGFPWQANIALIGAFAAKEVFVSTMATAYSMGEVAADEADPLSEKLAADPAWTMPAVLAVFAFMLLYTPCMVTVVAIAKETNWKWGLFSVFGALGFAYIVAVLIYQIGSALA
ncbi:ferrous iron transport protein B [Solidesulfovibrio carbinoliphilus subsp. oakridgensis]|uniref:Ferrous iron transport protein B n=1 Tax=Solidesulfovibrio carbinoliphilus subsp. oakridgensis TaxID=694327 RepID=G7Q4Z9_9BACT|nr:ferrous iron transport protein B [Solidesulfovibrio carbinoliphilus]EHJ47926.1 ferrous iron transport protein B [Solidesulfovibrio carbinoliphilus subsp. oakridgensis]